MRKQILAVAMVFSLCLAGCQTWPTKAALQGELDGAKTQLVQAQAQLAAQQAASTQPGSGVTAPSKQSVDAVKAISDRISQLQAAVNALPTDGAINPGSAIQAASPIAGPAAGWVYLVGTLVSIAFGIYQKVQAGKSATALATTTSGLQAAIDTKAITVTANAPAIVDAAVTDHPATDVVIDMLSDAAGTPRIK